MTRDRSGRKRLSRWLLHGDGATEERHGTHPWWLVLWLTGVDYFSTLGYQPGIALLAAGALAPVSTALLVVVTLLGALPIYSQVAARSYAGQGSIAMLENLLPGWRGKILVLALLGFAATDFVITMTLSAADATQHAIENPFLHDYLGDARLELTLGLLALLAIVFLKGFAEAIGVAAFVAIPYLFLNLIVLLRGLVELLRRPELVESWKGDLFAVHADWTGLLVASALIFPRLALGLSGFETGVSVMPLVRGDGSDTDRSAVPAGRVRNSRKLLATAAIVMSFYLLLSSFVTTLLVPTAEYQQGGAASGRVIAYLAHGFLGPGFGSVYDAVTILILWFAGASAMAGLLNLIPRYLPRFGMAPRWVAHRRPLVLVLFAISAAVTWIFEADVEAQGGAYATGVLALILSAAIAVALANWREFRQASESFKGVLSVYFWIVAAVFAFTFVENILDRPDGLVISVIFIVIVLGLSAASRYQRATELRVSELSFADAESERLWRSILGKKVSLVPSRRATEASRGRQESELRSFYRVNEPLAFVRVELLDNRSDFLANLVVRVRPEGNHFAIQVSGAVAIANTIAYISELIDPVNIFLGLTRQNLMNQSFRFLLWGEGETGLRVYQILIRHWESTPEDDVRPRIFLVSD